MCCSRCILVVEQVLSKLEINYKSVGLGCAIIHEADHKETQLKSLLKKSGFEIIHSKDKEVAEKAKIAIHKIFMNLDDLDLTNFNFKEYLEAEVQLPYKQLSLIFSKENKKTIEKYFILRRIEKAKSMITDLNSSFSEIAFKLGYNSLAYLSKQFKAHEGKSMREYKTSPKRLRRHVDKL